MLNISTKSTKEEIAQFFSKEYNISEEAINNIIKQGISGDILLYLEENDFDSLRIKFGAKKRIQLYLKENRDKFIEKQINITVNDNSSVAQVIKFFEEYVIFEGNLNEMDGQTMFKLSEEQMKNLGLNIGQRKRLIKYIKHVKNANDNKKYKVKITKKSTQKEVNQFLKEELKFADKAIDELGLDAISLFLVTEKEIDDSKELNQEEKENYKNFLNYWNEKEEKQVNDLNKEDKKEDITINEIEEKKEVNNLIKETYEKANEKNIEDNIGKKEIVQINEKIKNKEENQNIELKIDIVNELKKDKLEEQKDEKLEEMKEDNIINEKIEKIKEDNIVEEKKDEKLEEITENIIFEKQFEEKLEDIKENNIIEEKKDEMMEEIKENNIIEEKKEKEYQNINEDVNIEKNEMQKEKELIKNQYNQKNDMNVKNKKKRKRRKKRRRQYIKKEEYIADETTNEITEEKEKKNEDLSEENIEENSNEEMNEIEQNTFSTISLNEQYNNNYNDENKYPNNNQNLNNSLSNILNNTNNENEIINNGKTINNHEIIITKENILIKKEYKGNISSKIKYSPLYKYKTTSIVEDSQYNLFFILILKEKDINKSYLSAFKDNSNFFFKEEYINYSHYFIDEEEKKKNYENIKVLMVQVPIEKKIKNLTINLLIEFSSYYNKNYKTNIDIEDGIENYFYLDNLNYNEYEYIYSSYYPTLDKNEIFTYFLNYFFNEKNNKDKTIKTSLLKAIMSKINSEIELSVENILKLFKYCLYLKIELKNINFIKIIEEKKYYIPNDLYLSNEDIHNFKIQKKEKTYLINIIIKIYASYNNKYLMELIQSKDRDEYTRVIFDLLNEKELRYEELVFNNQKDNLAFKKSLLQTSKNKKEVNYVVKLSKGLTSCLEFILENIKTIYSILNKNKSFILSNESNYLLSLSELEKDISIDKICELLKQILEFDKECKIINLEKIFDDLIDLFSNKSLNELYNLFKIEKLLESNKIKLSNAKKLYNKIHYKGLQLIQNKQMNIEEIIDFIYSKDIYYYDSKYKKDELRDPKLFRYIPITESDPNYKTNKGMLKKNEVWKLYADSTSDIQKKFYESFLCQIHDVKHLHNIFDLFSIENIDKNFNILINKKLDSIIYTALDEKKENYNILFDIFKNILRCNLKNNLEQKIYELDYDFTSQFFFELLKSKSFRVIVDKIKQKIIDFFLKQKREGKVNEEQLILLLLLSPNNNFSMDLLNQMNNMVLTENDFYEKEDTKNFILFKIFFEKCENFIKNEEISNGKYLFESMLVKSKLYDDLSNSKVKYETIKNLIDEENLLYNKIMVIFDRDTKASRDVFNKIKKNIEICTNKFEKFEIIEEYYNIFFKNTKQRIIDEIGKKLNELKQKNLDELVILNEKDIIVDNEFNLELSIKESENIKYKDSLFFMSIYNEKKNNEFFDISEKQMFDEAKKEFENSLTRIINQPETKEAFFEINNINEIMNVIKNKENYNMEDEIKFIQKEFAHLKKESYILKNLLDDLINFSNKEKIQRLIQGIIYFIETYKKIVSIEETRFLIDFRSQLDILNSKGVSGEQIKGAIKLLNKYNLKGKTSLNKFYEIFLDKEESLLFIKKIKDANLEIRNLNEFIDENENSQLQTTDIDNLLDVYTFFKKIMDNKNIKTDEDFFNIFNKNFESQKNIIIQLQGYLSCYGEIIQLFQLYDENSEMTIQKIYNILKSSKVEISKEENDCYIYKIIYLNQKEEQKQIKMSEIDELKNKILISSTNTNLKEEGKQDRINKKNLTNQFIKLIDNIKQLTNTLNSLLKSGYPDMINLLLSVEDSSAFENNNKEKNLQKIIEEYMNINNKNKKTIKRGYEKFPLLRSYYGQQFIQLYEKVKGNESNISNLVSLMTLKKIKNYKVQYKYNNEINNLENINNYLNELYKINQVNIEDIYNKNKVIDDIGLNPGLYRKIRSGDNSEMIIFISF